MNPRSLSGALGSHNGVGGGSGGGRNGVSRAGGGGASVPRRKLKIRPFARKPEVPTTFFPVTWETRLRPAVRAVQTATALEGFSLEELYGAVEDSVRHGHAAALYDHISIEVESHIGTVVSALEAAAAATADSASFLTDANRAWESHCAQMSTIRAIFLVLDRGYVLAQPGTATVLPLWQLSLRHFRSALDARPSVATRIASGLLDVIRRERDGDSIDVTLVTSLASMLSAVGVYANVFEGPFLASTAHYFASESARLIDSMDLSAYLAHVEARLNAEAARVTSCLDATTRRPLIVIVERHLLAVHVQALLDKGFATLANEGRVADLARLWLLYGRVDAIRLPINVPYSSNPDSVDVVAAATRGGADGAMDRIVPGGAPGTVAALGPAQESIKAALGLYVRERPPRLKDPHNGRVDLKVTLHKYPLRRLLVLCSRLLDLDGVDLDANLRVSEALVPHKHVTLGHRGAFGPLVQHPHFATRQREQRAVKVRVDQAGRRGYVFHAQLVRVIEEQQHYGLVERQ